jgi:hypothetical protein
LAARARPCAARTRLFKLIATPNRALRAPPPIAASLLFLCIPQVEIKKSRDNLPNSGRPREVLFSFTWKTLDQNIRKNSRQDMQQNKNLRI